MSASEQILLLFGSSGTLDAPIFAAQYYSLCTTTVLARLLVYDDGVTVAVKRFARSFACIFSGQQASKAGSRRPCPCPCPCLRRYAHRMTVKSTIFSRLRSTRLPSNRPRPRPHPPSIVHPYNLTQARNIILHTSHLLRTKLIHIHYIISRLQSIVLRPCPNNAPSRSSSGCFERHSTLIAVVDRHPRPEPSSFNVFSAE
jgi:hypothetical protein